MAIVDWFSRFVLGWSLNITMEADFCVETLQHVLQQSQCDIFNSDQGAQFTLSDFTDVLKAHHIKVSMDGKGRALDNVFVERLWRSVKYECVYLQDWSTVKEAHSVLDRIKVLTAEHRLRYIIDDFRSRYRELSLWQSNKKILVEFYILIF